MADVQSIAIISHETKHDPKPYVTYNVKVSTPTRSWTVQRRYNDFVSLNAELKASVGKPPPAELPSKHSLRFSISRSIEDEQIINERRTSLEAYLRSILTHKDPRWRMAYTFADFLSIPSNAPSRSATGSTSTKLASYLPSSQGPHDVRFSSTSWLTEHSTLQSHLRTVRSSLLKRDTLAQLGDSTSSRSASVEAKRLIKETRTRLDALDKGLAGVEGLGAGERTRREAMVVTLRDELGNLDRMAEAGVRVAATSAVSASPGRSSSPANESARAALLGTAPPTRVFGAAAAGPQETAETRPLDDRGLVQLQQQQMDTQDSQLEGLSAILRRQRRLGEEIGREIGEQNELLDDLGTNVDRVGGKLGRAKREMNRLHK